MKKTASTTDLSPMSGVSQPPRICLLTETYHPVKGGGETQARALAENLFAQGFTVCVVARRSSRTLKKIETSEGVIVYRIPPVGAGRWTRWRMLAASFFVLAKLRDRYDILFVSGFKALGVSAVIVSKVFCKTCILKADSNGEMSGRFFTAGLKQWGVTLSSPLVRLLVGVRNAILRRADAFVAITTEIAEEFKNDGVKPALIHRTPNSVDTSRFYPVSAPCKESLRTRLELPKREIIVTYSGRLVSYKGLPLLVRVAEQLQKTHRNAGFVLVGAGGIDIHNCEAELREYVSARGLDDVIRFTGEVDNVEEYLQASDIFVSPTEKDAFPLALIEAMACGLAVVSTPIGGIKEIITSQKNGLLVEVGSFDQLYKGIETLILDPALRASLGSSAVQSVQAQYSAKSITARYAELFRATRFRYVANP